MRIILVGGDKTVYFLARQLQDHGHHVTLINRDEGRSEEIARLLPEIRVVLGEGSDPKLLEEAGARRADTVLALTSHDQDNLIICQIAGRLFKVPRTIALVNDPENEGIFQKLGITVAFSATRIIASMIEQQASLEDVIGLMSLAEGKINLIDIRLDEEAPAVGKYLQEVPLSQSTLVACIIREGKAIIPRGNHQLLANDHLLLISQPDSPPDDLRQFIIEDRIH